MTWDDWRRAYPAMTVRQQHDFHDEVYREYPRQHHYDLGAVLGLLDRAAIPDTVIVELGGWDGELAADVLARRPEVASWTNYEICPLAARNSACRDRRYRALCRGDWYWNARHDCDVFVASHVIEHLSAADLGAVLRATHARWLYLDAPLGQEGRAWTGDDSTHILTWGWRQVLAAAAACGYEVAAGPRPTCPRSPGASHAYYLEHTG